MVAQIDYYFFWVETNLFLRILKCQFPRLISHGRGRTPFIVSGNPIVGLPAAL